MIAEHTKLKIPHSNLHNGYSENYSTTTSIFAAKYSAVFARRARHPLDFGTKHMLSYNMVELICTPHGMTDITPFDNITQGMFQ